MKIQFSSFSHVGPRSSNQDRVLEPEVVDGQFCVAAIADGIGGAAGGDIAAEVAIDCARHIQGSERELMPAFARIVEKMRELSEADIALAKMGTTLSIALVRDKMVHTAHVGDTRIYHLRGSGLRTLTQDQTEVAELLRKGVLSKSQAKRYPRRNVLLSALSPAAQYEVHYSSSTLEVGDRLLLISDGVYQRLDKSTISGASLTNVTVEAFVRAVEHSVSGMDPTDNFSAVGIEIVSW